MASGSGGDGRGTPSWQSEVVRLPDGSERRRRRCLATGQFISAAQARARDAEAARAAQALLSGPSLARPGLGVHLEALAALQPAAPEPSAPPAPALPSQALQVAPEGHGPAPVLSVGSLVQAGAELVWYAGGVPSITINPPFSPNAEPVVYDWAPRAVLDAYYAAHPEALLVDSGASTHSAAPVAPVPPAAPAAPVLPEGLVGPVGPWLPPPAPWQATPGARAEARWLALAEVAIVQEERVLRARRLAAWVTRRRLRFAPDPFASEEEEETEEVSTSVVPSPATWARLEQALWVLARLIRLLVQVVRLLLRPTGSDVARLAGPHDE